MTGPSEFVERFEEFVRASGWRTTPSPAELIGYWRDFVETCEEGYSSTINDYENERAVRDFLDKALHNPILPKFAELDGLRASVEEIDERFRRACRDDVAIGDADAPCGVDVFPVVERASSRPTCARSSASTRADGRTVSADVSLSWHR